MRTIVKAWMHCEASDIKDKETGRYYPEDHSVNHGKIILHKQTFHDFGYISVDRTLKEIWINFQGSDDVFDWVNNFRAIGTPKPLRDDDKFDRREIHKGFYKTWGLFKDWIDTFFDSYDYKQYNVYCCGHSRGGAIAQLAARHISKNRKTPCDCISFGAPRVFGKKARNQFNLLPINAVRVEFKADIVTKMPFKSLGYRLAGRLYRLPTKWWHYLPWMVKKVHLNYGIVKRM